MVSVMCNQNQTWLGLGIIIFVTVFASTLAHDHQKNGILVQNNGKTSQAELLENGLKNGEDDYDWHNIDDYEHPEYSNDDPNQNNSSEDKSNSKESESKNPPSKTDKSDKNEKENQTKKIEPNPVDDASKVSNVTIPDKPQSNTENKTVNIPNDVSNDIGNSTSTNPETSDKIDTKTANNETQTDQENTDQEQVASENEESVSNNQTENTTIPSSIIRPSPIVTEDVGGNDGSSGVTFETSIMDRLDSSSFRDWSVVVTSALISFALIFTILYFVRNALIRKRRADQRRLLHSSISAEGYFYGDGDGIGSGKFEL